MTTSGSNFRALPFLVLLLSLGCESNSGQGDDELSPDAVTQIPEGDAAGTEYSGEYDSEVVTADCSGQCGPIGSVIGSYSLCDIGNVDEDLFEAEHEDGTLRIRAASNYFVELLEGGVDKDGTFSIGGFSTQDSGNFKATNLVDGTIDDDGTLEGTARAHMWGTLDGTSVNCVGTYDVRATLEDG